jgi:hypothetical protein
MPSSLLPVIDTLEQDQSTGNVTPIASLTIKLYQFTPSSDSSLSPDLTADANGVLSGGTVSVAAGTSIRARSTCQGMANYCEVVSG